MPNLINQKAKYSYAQNGHTDVLLIKHRLASLSTRYQTARGKTPESLKSIRQF